MNSKKLIVKRLDKELPMPKYATEGSVGLDLVARETVVFETLFVAKLVPLNIIVKTPDKYATLLLPRSSLFKKKGLILVNSVGVIDRDYCGNEDEIKAFMMYCPSTNIHGKRDDNNERALLPCGVIERGEVVCQLLFTRIDNDFDIVEVDDMGTKSRGGYGSTGGYANDNA